MKATVRVYNKLRNALSFIASCPRCWPYWFASVLMLGCLGITAWFIGVPGVDSLQKHMLTTTMNVTTESFRFVTPVYRETAWSLPPGRFSILGIADNAQCTVRRFESSCEFDTNTRLIFKGAAEVTMQATPTGGWVLSVAAEEEQEEQEEQEDFIAMDARLLDADSNLLLQSDQLMAFHANTFESAIRMPFVAKSAILGSNLHQSSSIDGSAYDFWQPVLLSGDVLMVADNKPGRGKYHVHSERLDPGDVVHIRNDPIDPTDPTTSAEDGDNSVWGMLTIGSGDQTAATPGAVAANFQIVLHTSLRDVSVTRFGAPDGHVIKASVWSILHKWPNGQAIWVAFVSALLILGFFLQLGAAIARGTQEAGSESPRLGLQDVKEKETAARIQHAREKAAAETNTLLAGASEIEAPEKTVDGLPKVSSHDKPDERVPEENKDDDQQISSPPH